MVAKNLTKGNKYWECSYIGTVHPCQKLTCRKATAFEYSHFLRNAKFFTSRIQGDHHPPRKCMVSHDHPLNRNH